MYIFFATPLYGGVGGQKLSSAKIEPQSNRDPKKKGDYCLPFLALLLLGYLLIVALLFLTDKLFPFFTIFINSIEPFPKYFAHL